MNVPVQLVADVLLALALLVWVGYRQTTWTAVDPGRMWKMPLILAAVGLIFLTQGKDGGLLHITALDVALLVVEVLVSVGLGALMGVYSSFRQLTDGTRAKLEARAARKGRSVEHVTLEARTGWVGLVLWLVLIVVRVGLGIVSAKSGAELTASSGIIMLMVAANRATRIAVILSRAGRVNTQQPVASLA
jgi:hypothetical protein